MNPERPPKKSETLEVRVPHATKQAFMARCREDGRSASEVIREFIDGHLARPSIQPERRKTMSSLFQPSLIAAAFAAAAVAVLGPTAGRAGPTCARPSARSIATETRRSASPSSSTIQAQMWSPFTIAAARSPTPGSR